MTVYAVVGGQYGSEGKGVIAHHLARKIDFGAHVRVGGPNAGHTIHTRWGKFAMQSIPVGWADQHHNSMLVLGRGAIISRHVLNREIDDVLARTGEDLRHRLVIDKHANILDEEHHWQEGGTSGELHYRIGSTGEGVGACRAALLARDPAGLRKAGDVLPWAQTDTVWMLDMMRAKGTHIMLEGTQGTGLSLVHGPWPFVTTCDPTVSGLSADSGVPMPEERIVVFRTFPIRVWGNSGPLKDEMSWGELGVPEERTTVTKKVRRVGRWDWDLFNRAIWLNRPTAIALTFGDYLDPETVGKATVGPETKRLIREIEGSTRVPVKWVATGPMAEQDGKIRVVDL